MAPVYGFCDANCKQPVYTVNETIAILEQLIQGGSLEKIDPALLPIVAAIKEQHNNNNIKFWLGTEAELNAIDPAVTTKLLMPRIDGDNNLYLCSDDSTLEAWKNEILATARALVTGYATPDLVQAKGINEYTHRDTGELTGSGANGKFKATQSGTYSTITVNGAECAVKCGEESEIELVAGVWYTFILDGTTINFKQGGAGLNFKVVGGTTTPASPKENTIWINTDVACGEYQFTTAEPTTKANGAALEIGDIWIKTHSYSDKTFNALKKNNVEISPINAYQWDGTAWKNKTAYIYISGAWVSLTMQFVTNGQRVTEFETLPNYWTTDISFKLAPTVTQYADNFQLYSKAATSGTRGGTVFLRTAVDFSKISTIEVTFSATSGDSDASLRLDLVCTTNKEHGYTPVATLNLYKSKTSIDENTAALDVSSITDMGYIGIAVGSCNTTNITMKITDFKAY